MAYAGVISETKFFRQALALHHRRVNGAEFDQPVQPIRSKIIICSTPRSGSYLLCRAMIQNGIGVPHEYFNWMNAYAISQRLGWSEPIVSKDLELDGSRRDAYLAALFHHRTANGIFAVKIQGEQFSQYLRDAPLVDLYRRARFIYLYRQDLLGQAISFHVSLLTGQWGNDETGRNPESISIDRFFDIGAIDNAMQILADQDRAWRLFLATHNVTPLFFAYEDVKARILETRYAP